jgi:riboflavin kinase/FMN adenylyltransferase
VSAAPSVVTVGTFDGVHLGHRAVLDRLAARAVESGLRSVLVTFDPHPLEVVNPSAAPPLLTVGSEKTEVLVESSVDHVVVLPFTPGLAALSAEAFVTEVLIARVGMRELLIGHDHGFGRGRGGNVEMLQSLAAEHGFTVDVIAPVGQADGHAISSTAIRRAIAGGDLARAAEGLGRPYAIGGIVRPGDGRGRSLGYRTINLGAPSPRKLLPPEGVYAVRVQTPRGAFGGMMNLGGRPTFGDATVQVEAHLFDTDVDLYGARVRVDLLSRLRDIRRFDDTSALRTQLMADELAARRVLTADG